ncbi:MAG: hypothetical protein ACM3MK_03495 [Chitinophagales bacterium]
MSTRGFWDGMLAGGIIGAAITMMYVVPANSKQPQRSTRIGRVKQMVEDIGEVAGSWRK